MGWDAEFETDEQSTVIKTTHITPSEARAIQTATFTEHPYFAIKSYDSDRGAVKYTIILVTKQGLFRRKEQRVAVEIKWERRGTDRFGRPRNFYTWFVKYF